MTIIARLLSSGMLLRDYRAERFRPVMAGGVSLLLAAAAQAGGTRRLAVLPADIGLALLLFAQFRILDDLADRRHDARAHPGRVLVRAGSVLAVGVTALLLATGTIGALLMRAAAPAAIAGWLLLIVLLAAWYTLRTDRTLLGDHLLLAKYPAFVWIIAVGHVNATTHWSAPLALSMLATFLAACVYEALHDGGSPAAARPTLVATEGVLLALTLTALSLHGAA